MMAGKAIVVGSRGQDGKLLCQLLIQKNYEVIEVSKGLSIDIMDRFQVIDLVATHVPEVIYFLAAHHHSSEENRTDEISLLDTSLNINVMALANFLEAIRTVSPKSRLFYAASSHIFGNTDSEMQDELTALNPNNLYGISKAAGVFACRYYRSQHAVHACVGILYNHESIYRDRKFVSKKIACAAASIKLGIQNKLVLGDLDAAVDWGYAPDYVDAMYRIMGLNTPDDYVIATGQLNTVGNFVRIAFACVGLDFKNHVETSGSLPVRGGVQLCGNPSKLMLHTDWRPSVTFELMIQEMVAHELKAIHE